MGDWWYDFEYLARYLPEFLTGLRVTAEVSVLGFMLAMVIGLVGAASRQSRIWLLRFVAGAYVEIIRNTPTLVQIFVVFFGLPRVGLTLSNFQAGVIALGISGGGYLIEILRSGFLAIPKGQREATASLGLSRFHTYAFVLLPQAIRTVYPPTTDQFIQTILGSSMLSTIGLTELTGQAQVIAQETYLTMQAFCIALAAYLILTNLVSFLAGAIGRHAFKPPIAVRPKRSFGNPWRARRSAVMLSGGQH